MRLEILRPIALSLAVVMLVSLLFVDAGAQRRRSSRRRARSRISNPVITTTPNRSGDTSQTSTTDAQIISTAEDEADEQNADQSAKSSSRRNTRTRTTAAQPSENPDSMRRTVNRLSTQVTRLTDKISQMEEQQRTLVNLERLTRAEQRAESLRAQLRDVQSKEVDLQARADQLEYEIKPENIERTTAVFGSTHPEELREQRRRQLENERTRVRAQLTQLEANRLSLESAIATADAEVSRLRQILEADTAATTPAGTTTAPNTGGTQTRPAATTTEPTQTTSPTTTPSSNPLP